MADEKIVIQIHDQIAPSIVKKLKEIADYAEAGQSAIKNLQNAMKDINDQKLAQARIHAIYNETARKNLELNNKIQRQHALTNAKIIHGNFTTHEKIRSMEKLTASKAIAEVKRAEAAKISSLARLRSAQARSSGVSQSFSMVGATSGGVGMALGAIGGIAGGYLGLQGAREVMALSGAYTDLQNKLKMVTESEGQLASVTNRVFEIANKTRVPVEDTAKAFVRFDLALKQLGATQGESLRLTETVNKMLIVSGASAGEAGSSLLQLSQAFNKGKLDGDEFRSVMELMPPVADAIAKRLGVTRGELLKLAPDGKITAQVMREALASVATEIDEKFAKTIPTVGQTLIQLKNTAIEAFGVMGKESGVMTSIVEALQEIEKWLKSSGAELLVFGQNVKLTFDSIKNIFDTVFSGDTSPTWVLAAFVELVGRATAKLDGMVTRAQYLGDALGYIATLNFKGLKGLAGEWKELEANSPEKQFKEKFKANMTKAVETELKNIQLARVNEEIKTLEKGVETLTNQKAWQGLDAVMKALGKAYQFRSELEGNLQIGPTNNELLGQKIADSMDNAGKKIDEIKVKYASLAQMNALGANSFNYLPTNGGIGWEQARALTPGVQLEQAQKQAVPMQEFILGQTSQEVMQEAFDPTLSMKAQYEKYYEDIDKLRSMDLVKEKKANEMKTFFKKKEMDANYDATANMFGSLGFLMESNSKEQFRIGKAATLAEASMRGVMAVQGALGAPPYGYAAIANAVAVGVMSAANIAKIANTQPPGFKTGGFTGYEGTSQVAGVVHGQEFVTNAAATARYRPMLERINKGGSAVSVTIENYGTNKDFEVQQVTPDQIRIIARDEVRSQVPSLMASEGMNPNSKFSKAMQNSTNLQRKRV